MKHFIFLILGSILFLNCAPKPTLYDWKNYNDRSYYYLKNADDKSIEELLAVYEIIINQPKGTRNVPPPGVMADYGFFLLQKNQVTEGRALLEKEMITYPESRPFVERILKMIES